LNIQSSIKEFDHKLFFFSCLSYFPFIILSILLLTFFTFSENYIDSNISNWFCIYLRQSLLLFFLLKIIGMILEFFNFFLTISFFQSIQLYHMVM
jgi:hypothetical protein